MRYKEILEDANAFAKMTPGNNDEISLVNVNAAIVDTQFKVIKNLQGLKELVNKYFDDNWTKSGLPNAAEIRTGLDNAEKSLKSINLQEDDSQDALKVYHSKFEAVRQEIANFVAAMKEKAGYIKDQKAKEHAKLFYDNLVKTHNMLNKVINPLEKLTQGA